MTKKKVIINVILMCALSQKVCHFWFWKICKRPLIPIYFHFSEIWGTTEVFIHATVGLYGFYLGLMS